MATILLIPIKLLAKAVLYLAAAALSAVGFIVLLVSAVLRKLGFLLGGFAVLGAIIAWFTGSRNAAVTLAAAGTAAILLPVIATFISSGIILLKEKLLDVSADIELV